MLRYLVSLSLLVTALAFSNPSAFTRTRVLVPRTFMFSGDNNAPAEDAAVVDAAPAASPTTSVNTAVVTPIVPESASFPTPPAPKGMVLKNLSKGGKVTEVKWRDPALEANISPFQMEWWAYILFGLPFVLLTNDFLHFLPNEGPLSFLTRM